MNEFKNKWSKEDLTDGGRIDDAINGSAEHLQSEVKRFLIFVVVLLVLFFSLPIIIINWY